jgi:hypothetical protein|tara:strand:+ start:131 stop:529 length:399 start_codon:yes stop_codon:yes gene_type:complete
MTKFALEEIKIELDENETICDFYSLTINGRNKFDEFKSFCDKNSFSDEFIKIQTLILTIAKGNERMLPNTKLKQLKRGKKDKIPDFEIKTKHLRLYFVKESNNRIVIMGGKKTNQTKDIIKLRGITKNYYNQ